MTFTVRVPAGEAVVGFGADKRSGWCVAAGGEARLSVMGGDLDEPEARESYTLEIEREMSGLAGATVAACDAHPDYYSTRLARRLAERVVAVQHHHAHFAAVLAEHEVAGSALGVIFDGMGLADDGSLWGGEFLVGDVASSRRAGHLLEMAQPGGDAAAREPWRMAVSYLFAAYGDDWPHAAPGLIARRGEREAGLVAAAARRGVNSPETSSAGRLFEAVGSLIGGFDINISPAAAAIGLEQLAAGGRAAPVPFECRSESGRWIVDHRPAIRAVCDGLARGVAAADLAAGFHAGLAAAVVRVCSSLGEQLNMSEVVLAGGVFQNWLLMGLCREALAKAGFAVLVGERVPVHDGGLALGQAAAALARLGGRRD